MKEVIKKFVGAATVANLINLAVVFMKEKTLEKLLETGTIPMGAFVIGLCVWAFLGIRALRLCSSVAAVLAVLLISTFNVWLISATVTHVSAAAEYAGKVPTSDLAATRVSVVVVAGNQPAGPVSYTIAGSEERFSDQGGGFVFHAEPGLTDITVRLGDKRHLFHLHVPKSDRGIGAELDLQSLRALLIP